MKAIGKSAPRRVKRKRESVWLNETNQMNQINQINKTNQMNQTDWVSV